MKGEKLNKISSIGCWYV